MFVLSEKGSYFTDTYSEYGFFERLTMLEKDFPGATILLHKLYSLPKVSLWRKNVYIFTDSKCIGYYLATLGKGTLTARWYPLERLSNYSQRQGFRRLPLGLPR